MWPMHLSIALDLAAERAREAHEAARRDALVRPVPDASASPGVGRIAVAALRSIEALASVVAKRAAAAATRLERRAA
jgi:hypothetical protein